jgi:hypothetical protein
VSRTDPVVEVEKLGFPRAVCAARLTAPSAETRRAGRDRARALRSQSSIGPTRQNPAHALIFGNVPPVWLNELGAVETGFVRDHRRVGGPRAALKPLNLLKFTVRPGRRSRLGQYRRTVISRALVGLETSWPSLCVPIVRTRLVAGGRRIRTLGPRAELWGNPPVPGADRDHGPSASPTLSMSTTRAHDVCGEHAFVPVIVAIDTDLS